VVIVDPLRGRGAGVGLIVFRGGGGGGGGEEKASHTSVNYD